MVQLGVIYLGDLRGSVGCDLVGRFAWFSWVSFGRRFAWCDSVGRYRGYVGWCDSVGRSSVGIEDMIARCCVGTRGYLC